MFHYFISEVPQLSISLPIGVFLIIYWSESRIKGSVKRLSKRQEALEGDIKDTEKLLVDRLDPELYKTLKRIVMKEEKNKLQVMKLADMGCTEKCSTKAMALKFDLERNQKIVDKMKLFEWCATCSQTDNSGAVKTAKVVCNSGCGHRFVNSSRPLFKEFQVLEA